MIKFTYYGDAVGKSRPRYSRRGDYVHTYTPKKTKNFEDGIKIAFMESYHGRTPAYEIESALYSIIDIGVSVPKSYSKKKREECLSGRLAPTKKPDIDNILKSIFDGLNGKAYEDDKQIVQIRARKVYADEPYITVLIGEIGELE